MADTGELLCYHRGCGRKFNISENVEGCCFYHPGVPVFHDALKGWSCCKKRSTDFTEFLNITGCTSGQHSNEKPLEAVTPQVQSSKENIEKSTPAPASGPPLYVEPPMLEPAVRPSKDAPMIRLTTTVGVSLKQQLEKQLQEMQIASLEGEEKKTSGVKIGESCKNNSCTSIYVSESTSEETCLYHPGCPIFHEGMKYWSCCRRKTSDFDNFLGQEGCTSGKHLWVKVEDPNKKVACRYDWHQTGGFVTISVFSKASIPEKTWVEVNQVAVNIHITFDKGQSCFEKQLSLRGIIDPSKSSVKLLGTKVEIIMRKAEPGSWPSLELLPKIGDNEENGRNS